MQRAVFPPICEPDVWLPIPPLAAAAVLRPPKSFDVRLLEQHVRPPLSQLQPSLGRPQRRQQLPALLQCVRVRQLPLITGD